jgi:hypothetical protein
MDVSRTWVKTPIFRDQAVSPEAFAVQAVNTGPYRIKYYDVFQTLGIRTACIVLATRMNNSKIPSFYFFPLLPIVDSSGRT